MIINIMILTKTIPFYQSREISKAVWKAGLECNYVYNRGIELQLEHNYDQYDMFRQMTKINKNIPWLNNIVMINRYSIDEARKAVNLFKTAEIKKIKKQQNGKKVRFTDPQSLYRKRHYNKQSAIGSRAHPHLNSDGSWRLGNIINITPKVDFDHKLIKSYQIVETTKRITKTTLPHHRTYELHIQYEYTPNDKTDGTIMAADIGAKNMIASHNKQTDESLLCRVPDGQYRYKDDEIDRLKSRMRNLTKHGQKWNQEQVKLKNLYEKKQNQRRDCMRKFTKQAVGDAKIVIAENLKPKQMLAKGRGKTGLNRTIQYAAIGETKDYIRHYCEKHNRWYLASWAQIYVSYLS